MSDYVKLKDLVDGEFTVQKVYNYQWKKWDNESKRMLISDNYEQGYRKVYGVVSDKGTFDLGSGQLGNLFEGVQSNGEANIVGRTFKVKSNGKTGMEIRYYLNPVKQPSGNPEAAPSWQAQKEKFQAKKDTDNVAETFNDAEPVDLSSIPF